MFRKRLLLCVITMIIFSMCKSQDFFLAKKYSDKFYYCITNTSYAMSWIKDDISQDVHEVSSYISNYDYNVSTKWDINDDFITNGFFLRHPWTLNQTMPMGQNHIILDERWEEFEAIKTKDNYNNPEFQIYTTIFNPTSINFDIPFSIRMKREAHMYLCDGNKPSQSNCYWLMMQAFNGEKTAIRKCKKGLIPASNKKLPSEPCWSPLVSVEHPQTPHYFSITKWSHFMLSKRENVLTFFQLEDNKQSKILELVDKQQVINVSHVLIDSKKTDGLWKIHQLNFMYTNEESDGVEFGPSIFNAEEKTFCLSMYVSMCETCKLKLKLNTYNDNEATFQSQNPGWTKIKFIAKNIPVWTVLNLQVSTIGKNMDSFWAIDKIRQCHPTEFRVIKLPEAAECQLMSGHDDIAYVTPEWNSSALLIDNKCPENTIGPFCVQCSEIFDNCTQIMTCTKNICSCSAGYLGKRCFYECDNDYYGYGCKNECGKCYYNRTSYHCNKIDGTCPYKKCIDKYSGPKCDIPPPVIFITAPKVTKISNTAVTVLVENFDTEIDKSIQAKPKYYAVQYKKAEDQHDQWVQHTQTYPFQETRNIKIDNLESETLYFVRGVVILSNGKAQVDDNLKFISFNTTCDEISSDNIQVSVSNTSATISSTRTTQTACKFYNVSIHGVKSFGYVNIQNETLVDNLEPFTQYTVVVRKEPLLQYLKNFSTLEGVPTEIQNFTIRALSSTTIQLEWTRPKAINGKLEHYIVEYQHTAYLQCDSKYAVPSTKTQYYVNNTSITINDLIPFSNYTFSVITTNKKLKGHSQSRWCTTPSSHRIEPEETQKIINIVSSDTKATIELSKILCNKVRGLQYIKIKTTCANEWCRNQKTTATSSKSTILLDNLLPFSNYSIQVQFCRKNGLCNTPEIRQFETKPSVPEKVNNLQVYSKNGSTICLRWLPPYPPNGILEEYRVNYSSNEQIKSVVIGVTPCRLWADFHCAVLYDLEKNLPHVINVSARNLLPLEFGEAETITAVTKTEKSGPPYDLKINWTLKNDMELEWKHPNETNGDILYFGIDIRNTLTSNTIRKELLVLDNAYNITYRYHVNFTELLPTTTYEINIFAYNGEDGTVVGQSTTSPPDLPIMASNPKMSSTNNTITLTLSLNELRGKTEIYHFMVLLSNSSQNVSTADINTESFGLDNLTLVTVCDASQMPKIFNITMGTTNNTHAHSCNMTENNPLQPQTSYNITVILMNGFDGEIRYEVYSFTYKTTFNSGTNWLLLSLLVLPILFIMIGLYLKKDKLTCCRVNEATKDIQIPLVESSNNIKKTKSKQYYDKIYENTRYCSTEIEVGSYENYVKASLPNRAFKRQHEFILEKIPTYEPFEDILRLDYIDMNYTNKFKVEKSYVVTKVPSESEIDDFWTMVWDANIHNVVLFNDDENLTCYWPDHDETLRYSHVIVECVAREIHQTYETRTLTLERNNEMRQVNQLCFSSPSDETLRSSAFSYVQFFLQMLKIPQDSKSPILVHSSSGMQGSAFTLLVDMSSRIIKECNLVDIFENLRKLTKNTTEMMIDYEHYVLAHLICLDILLHINTEIHTSDINPDEPCVLTSETILEHLTYLKNTLWIDCCSIEDEEEDEEEIYGTAVFGEESKPLISPDVLKESSSLEVTNVIKMQCFGYLKKFLLVKQPQSLTNFLSAIKNNEASAIITLNENISTWLDTNDETIEIVKNSETCCWKILQITTKMNQSINIIAFKKWPQDSLPTFENFADFVIESTNISKKVESIFVTGFDDVTAAGLYIVMACNTEIVKTVDVCDICSCVRRVRRNCEDFVTNEGHYKFLLETLQNIIRLHPNIIKNLEEIIKTNNYSLFLLRTFFECCVIDTFYKCSSFTKISK